MNLTTLLSLPRPAESSHSPTWPATLTQPEVRSLVARFTDWDVALMVQIAMCESSWQPRAWNPVIVWQAGVPLHSSGLLGVLGGSFDPVINVRQAHVKYLAQGTEAWQGDFLSGCAWR